MEPIKVENLEKILKEYKGDRTNTVIRHALANNELAVVAKSNDNLKDIDFKFSIDVPTMRITNQKQSGRCWIFAALNVLREKIAKEINVDQFELSQSYVALFDKLEKLNWTCEAIIDTIKADYDDRTVSYLVGSGIGDGGQWDMFVSIVKKYGICPKNVFQETFTSSSTMILNKLVNTELRRFASDSRAAFKKGGISAVRKLKDNLMKRYYKALVSVYGIPPEKFDFEYVDKNKKYHLVKGFTPVSFFEKYVGKSIDDYVSIINAPTKDKPFNKSYTIEYLGNVVGGKVVTHLNLPMNRMKELIINSLKDNNIVWFGSDVGFYGDRSFGVWDDNRFDYKSLFDLDFKMNKGESLDFKASQMGHAMVITGVNIKNGKPTKWKIENSWGDITEWGGYFIMSDSYFDQYVYQAVVDKKYLTDEEYKQYKAKPIMLKPWDPMGSLAD